MPTAKEIAAELKAAKYEANSSGYDKKTYSIQSKLDGLSSWKSAADVASVKNQISTYDLILDLQSTRYSEDSEEYKKINEKRTKLKSATDYVDQVGGIYANYDSAEAYDAEVKWQGYYDKHKGLTSYSDVTNYLNTNGANLSEEESGWLRSYGMELASIEELETEYSQINSPAQKYNAEWKKLNDELATLLGDSGTVDANREAIEAIKAKMKPLEAKLHEYTEQSESLLFSRFWRFIRLSVQLKYRL